MVIRGILTGFWRSWFMGILRDLYHLVSEFIRFISDPDTYRKDKMRDLDEARERTRTELETRYGELRLLSPEGPTVKRFKLLSDAVDFISKCLEEDDPLRLGSEIEGMIDQIEQDPDYLVYFIDGIYRQLKDMHEERDLREMYKEREFPLDQDEFTLGGYDPVLFRLHIEFAKYSNGWSIRRVYLTR
jgi:hypothetical protein